MTIHLFRPVSVVTHKLVEFNKTCMAAILRALSSVMNENRRNQKFTVIKQLKMRDYSKDTHFSLNYYIHVVFISTFTPSLTSCILNVVDVRLTSQWRDVKKTCRRDSNIPALNIEQLHWKSSTG